MMKDLFVINQGLRRRWARVDGRFEREGKLTNCPIIQRLVSIIEIESIVCLGRLRSESYDDVGSVAYCAESFNVRNPIFPSYAQPQLCIVTVASGCQRFSEWW